MKDLTVIMEDRPGKLAELGEATGMAGVNIEGLCAMVGDGKGFIHLLVQDEATAKKALAATGGVGPGFAVQEASVKAPLAARKFKPGQFYRLQNFESYAPMVDQTRRAELQELMGQPVEDLL